MKNILNSRYFYFLFPIYLSLALIIFFFNVPNGFGLSLFSFYFVVTPIVILSSIFYPWPLDVDKSYQFLLTGKNYKNMAVYFGLIIFISGPIDILINGFKLINPLTYAEFNGIGRYIRHISIMCWVLIPISFVFIKNKGIKVIIITYALFFPILIVDRNRLLMSFYVLIFCNILSLDSIAGKSKSKLTHILKFISIPLGVFLIFSILGQFRSGDAFLVGSSGDVLSFGAFPLNANLYYLPELLQQVILYITTPIFNFSTIVFFDFINENFLLSQLSPFGRDLYDVYPDAPIMVERFNVGTEFYPWLLYGGLPAVVLVFIFIIISFFCSISLLKWRPNIFTLAIFLKISYSILFMGFAPQFFILLNFSFIFLMLGLWFGAFVMESGLIFFASNRSGVPFGS